MINNKENGIPFNSLKETKKFFEKYKLEIAASMTGMPDEEPPSDEEKEKLSELANGIETSIRLIDIFLEYK